MPATFSITARARVSVSDREAVLHGILPGMLGEFVDAALESEDVGRCAKSAQRRGAHRRFRDQMMEHAFGGNIVKRVTVARGAAAIGFRHVIRRRLRRRIGQGEGAEQISARAGTLVVRGTPDFLRPVRRLAVLVEQRTNLDDHGRRLRLVDEFFLASPAHADRSGPASAWR